jgi:hypothetical protein
VGIVIHNQYLVGSAHGSPFCSPSLREAEGSKVEGMGVKTKNSKCNVKNCPEGFT